MRRYTSTTAAFFIFNCIIICDIFAGEHTSLGISFEKSMIFDNQISGINYTKLSISKLKLDKASFQISAGFGISNNLDKGKLSETINGRIKAFELDLSLRGHFFNRKYPLDYYFILGFNIEALSWKYREAFEIVDEYGYGEYVDKDGTTGIGFYCGVGVASLILGDLKFSLESQPGIVIISPLTNCSFTNILNNIYYLKFNFSIIYDPK